MFFTKKNKKALSRLPVDLTAEQMLNADAASQPIGTSEIKNSFSARQRWAENHYVRQNIISHLFEELNVTEKEDMPRGLNPNRIKKYAEHLEKLILTIT